MQQLDHYQGPGRAESPGPFYFRGYAQTSIVRKGIHAMQNKFGRRSFFGRVFSAAAGVSLLKISKPVDVLARTYPLESRGKLALGRKGYGNRYNDLRA